jgi:hypothetical protein
MWWEVYGPEVTRYAGAYEPPDYGRDWVLVEAPTRREAIRLGVRAMLSRLGPDCYCREIRGAGSPPWKGIRARLLPEHGPVEEWVGSPLHHVGDDVAGPATTNLGAKTPTNTRHPAPLHT